MDEDFPEEYKDHWLKNLPLDLQVVLICHHYTILHTQHLNYVWWCLFFRGGLLFNPRDTMIKAILTVLGLHIYL